MDGRFDPTPHWQDIPQDLFFNIHSSLTIEQIWETRLVSKWWNRCGYRPVKAKCVARDSGLLFVQEQRHTNPPQHPENSSRYRQPRALDVDQSWYAGARRPSDGPDGTGGRLNGISRAHTAGMALDGTSGPGGELHGKQ